MNAGRIAVGLDIGTTKIVCVIGKQNEHGKIEIMGMGRSKSTGVKGGVVVNIVQTEQAIKEAVQQAEEDSGLKVKSVIAGIAGKHIRSLQHSDYINRADRSEEVIEQDDIDRLIENVHKLVMVPGEEIIHVLPQEYKIDGQGGIKEPIGMHGSRLEANLHVVVGQTSSIRNIMRSIQNANLDLADITLEPLASAGSSLAEDEKEAGVALIDIGGGTTDIAIFKDGIIRHTAVIPLGGKIITDDIKEGCEIIEKQAELLKIRFGSAWPGENSANEVITIPGLRGRDPKEVSKKSLSKIIHARVTEIIGFTFSEIKKYGHDQPNKRLIAGLVMTGGGSQLKHIKQLVEYETGMSTRKGYPNEHLATSTDKEILSPQYATAIGLLKKGLESEKVVEDMAIDPMKVAIETPEPKPQVIEETETPTEEMPANEQVEATNETDETNKKKPDSFLDVWFKKLKNFLENDAN